MKEQIIEDFTTMNDLLFSVFIVLIIVICLLASAWLFMMLFKYIKQGCVEIEDSKPAYFFKDQYGEFKQRVVLNAKSDNETAKIIAKKNPLWYFILLREYSIYQYADKSAWTQCKDFNTSKTF